MRYWLASMPTADLRAYVTAAYECRSFWGIFQACCDELVRRDAEHFDPKAEEPDPDAF